MLSLITTSLPLKLNFISNGGKAGSGSASNRGTEFPGGACGGDGGGEPFADVGTIAGQPGYYVLTQVPQPGNLFQ